MSFRVAPTRLLVGKRRGGGERGRSRGPLWAAPGAAATRPGTPGTPRGLALLAWKLQKAAPARLWTAWAGDGLRAGFARRGQARSHLPARAARTHLPVRASLGRCGETRRRHLCRSCAPARATPSLAGGDPAVPALPAHRAEAWTHAEGLAGAAHRGSALQTSHDDPLCVCPVPRGLPRSQQPPPSARGSVSAPPWVGRLRPGPPRPPPPSRSHPVPGRPSSRLRLLGPRCAALTGLSRPWASRPGPAAVSSVCARVRRPAAKELGISGSGLRCPARACRASGTAARVGATSEKRS